MIVYKIDKQPHAKVNSYIQDMAIVLEAIAPTLESLQEALKQHGAAISAPSIDDFRDDLQQAISSAVKLANTISADSQKLATVSDQASKHLVAIDEHFGAALRGPSTATSATVQG